MFKKFLIAIFLLAFFFITFSHQALANDITDYCDTRSGNVINLETWYSGKCFKGGSGNDSPASGQYRGFSDIVLLDLISKITEGITDLTGVQAGRPGNGVLASIAFLTAKVATTPPASSTDYLAEIGHNLQKHSLVKPAYAAQGFGFTALQPVLKAWQGLRNIAYAAYILIFVLYGFMIMFRVKIDPKVVTTFQLAIPKLIVTLLLITFSYAIAGLMIDLMYLISLGVGTALQSAGLINLRSAAVGLDARSYLTGNGLSMLAFSALFAAKIFLTDAIDQIYALITGIPTVISILIGSWAISLVVKIILLLALVYVMFKIFFMFIQSYAKIILQIIFSPIILLGNVLPGNDAFGTWARGLFAEMSVFPTTMIMLMIASTLIDTGFFGIGGGLSPLVKGDNTDLWVPPGLGGVGLGGGTAAGASAILGYSIFLLTPKMADMIRDALKIPPFKYDKDLSAPLSFGVKPGTAPLSAAWTGVKTGVTKVAGQRIEDVFNRSGTRGSAPADQGR